MNPVKALISNPGGFLSSEGNRLLPECLAVSSSILWLAGILTSRHSISGLGIISGLNPMVVLAIAMLVLAMFAGSVARKGKLFFGMALVILSMELNLIPLILEQTPRTYSTWRYYGYAEYILRNGRIEPLAVWYHTWPGSPLLITGLASVTGLDAATMMMAAPIVVGLVAAGIVYALATSLYPGSVKPWLAAAFFILVLWVDQMNFTAQSLGFLLYLLMLCLCYHAFLSNDKLDRKTAALGALIIFVLFITHLLTFIVATVTYCIAIGLRAFTKRRAISKKTIFALVASLAVASILGTAWLTTSSGSWVADRIGNSSWMFSNLFNFGNVLSNYISKLTSGSGDHRLVVEVRIALSAMAIAIVGIAIAINYRAAKRNNVARWGRRPWRSLLVMGLVTASLVVVIGYTGEIFERVFLFVVPIAAILALLAFNDRRVLAVVMAFLLIVPPLTLISKYGNERIDFASKSEISGVEQFYRLHGTEIGWVLFYSGNTMENYRYIENYATFTVAETGLLLEDGRLNVNASELPRSVYFWYTSGDGRINDFLFDDGAGYASVLSLLEGSNHWTIAISGKDITVFKYCQ